jgi:NAD(P)-dependent dehydrogenase (short-subunit alcohol dehydrogenase family)
MSAIPDLSGKLTAGTGTTSGIGLALANALAGGGAEVIMAVHNQAKGEGVVAHI